MPTKSSIAAGVIVVLTVAFLFFIIIVASRTQVAADNLAMAAFEERTIAALKGEPGPIAPRDFADLRAQERMADASELLASLTIAQLIVGALGTIAVVVTLWFNRRAISHSAEQVQAAQKQIKLNQQLGLLQLRAYISIEQFTIKQERPNFWRVKATVQNRGQTPALNARVWMVVSELYQANNNIPWDDAHARTGTTHRNMMAPNGFMGPSAGKTYKVPFLSAAALQNARIWTTVLVEYEDVFGTTYQRRASMTFTGKDFVKPAPATQGNEEIVISRSGFAAEVYGAEPPL